VVAAAGVSRPLEKSTGRTDDELVTEQIRQIIGDHARLSIDVAALSPHDDLYQAGMTSHASVNVMLALEDHFDVEFPDRMLTRSVFESMASIEAALSELRSEAALP
jgi:acyl carrier protein